MISDLSKGFIGYDRADLLKSILMDDISVERKFAISLLIEAK